MAQPDRSGGPALRIQHALAFLRAVREDPSVHARLEQEEEDLQPEDLVAMGAGLRLIFTPDELTRAFRHDWTLRSLMAASTVER